jgi:hypothetical protein
MSAVLWLSDAHRAPLQFDPATAVSKPREVLPLPDH